MLAQLSCGTFDVLGHCMRLFLKRGYDVNRATHHAMCKWAVPATIAAML
jgi:hypothetical protein